MNAKTNLSFELGPIRPPNEARSLLLRFTRNCPWNQCLFCPAYKGKKFSLRSLDEIKKDIQAARDIADEVKEVSWRLGYRGEVNDEVISYIFAKPQYNECYRMVAIWLYYGTGAVFLQDADNLLMKTDDLVEALRFLRVKFPEITRITTYSRARTIYAKKTVDALRRIREAGLDRVHIGLESGYDPVLKFMRKGVTAQQHIEAGKRLIEAGMELSEYVMPGLGGKKWWREHAIETARVLNQINPHFIRLRSLRIPKRVPLYKKVESGEFVPLTDDEVVEEIRLFIENLDVTSTVTSDHIMNLLEEVEGKMPEDKEKMLDVIRKYQELDFCDRLIYRVGRRGATYRSTDDLKRDPVTYRKIRNFVKEIKEKEGLEAVERVIKELVDQYV